VESWICIFYFFLYNAYLLPDREIFAAKNGEKQMSVETDEQIKLRAFLRLLSELQSKGNITGQQFREYRELWINQQPNDREVTVWDLKKLLNDKAKPALLKNQSNEMRKKPKRQRL
jgi:hypothetical protein